VTHSFIRREFLRHFRWEDVLKLPQDGVDWVAFQSFPVLLAKAALAIGLIDLFVSV
jgi:hypothetical protein